MKSHMDTYYESFACEIQSDENWVETLIQMENINRLLEEDMVPSSSGLGHGPFTAGTAIQIRSGSPCA